MDLRLTFVLANEFKEGDLLVGGADDARGRDEARCSLQALRLGEIFPAAFVDDGVTESLERSLNAQALALRQGKRRPPHDRRLARLALSSSLMRSPLQTTR